MASTYTPIGPCSTCGTGEIRARRLVIPPGYGSTQPIRDDLTLYCTTSGCIQKKVEKGQSLDDLWEGLEGATWTSEA